MDLNIVVGEKIKSPFLNEVGVYQDGTVPMYRDVDGTLWGISGHSHMGQIAMFAGKNLDDMVKKYPIQTNFCVGHADFAFDHVRYPEGIKARGSIWPFGLYICPKTHRFFCWFHNESGWNGKGTAYDSLGLCKSPHFDSDFRHVGLMHSDDEGKNWTFDRWVLTAEEACFTEAYRPDPGLAKGQERGKVRLGSGDFSLYIEPDGDYIYIFYDIIQVDMDKGVWLACDTYLARCRKREDGLMGDFVKYWNGAFCEAGNMGKEDMIVKCAWHPRVVYSEKYKKYVLTSSPIQPETYGSQLVMDILEYRTSDDLIHWSEPKRIPQGDGFFGNHYMAIVEDKFGYPPNVVKGNEFSLLSGHNGTDVDRFLCRFE